ncbi:MAG: UDP-glucose/GDP-mannose dehydrogenase family protein [Brevundimonas sp.]|uniref:UDP-glucose dehydrogenase family protein n=1 Tax=Brevundimonas sp. TaxID=1871086 RepID=UPI001803BE9D|nr:UDP-glucose/GDP-mannose dehydrogenase family protein [Brevundimonas sp.]MBA4803853.1 UDP-glucose/GDP-mannose dehydrogenase family protein [Brevundimonas sp.]
MKIGVIGAGYVGLVTGTCLAALGHEVVCVDTSQARIDLLNCGGCPIYEPGLIELIGSHRGAGRLRFSTDLAEAVVDRAAVFIAVGTPPGPDGAADLSYVRAAAAQIAPHLSGFTVVATKSTVPVGTGDEIEAILAADAPAADVAVVSNPEFLREGAAIGDFMKPDRIVVGADDRRAAEVMRRVYAPLTEAGAPLLLTDRRTSELIKYASNAFLAVKISYINEIADLCEEIGADAARVAEGMGLDARIGPRFLQPGPGFGGSCFPKDTEALLSTGAAAGQPLRVVSAAAEANRERKRLLAARVAAVAGDLEGRTVGVLGLTFKAGTDDMREAAALELIPGLQQRGARVRAYDPKGMEAARDLLPGVAFCDDPYAAAEGAAAVVVLTEWGVFGTLDLERLAQGMETPRLIDLRNLFDPAEAARAGLDYVSLGRPAVQGAAATGRVRSRPDAERRASASA